MNIAQHCTVVACVAAFACGEVANAQQTPPRVNLATMTLGYTYFNRPGADIATHESEVKYCMAQAEKMRSYDEINNVTLSAGGAGGVAGAAAAGVVGGIIQGGLAGAYHHGAVGASLEDCMVVRGWRVVSLPDTEGAELAALPQAILSKRLAAWIGAATPHGTIVRVWGNDAARPGTVRLAYRPAHTNNGQLSLLSATGQDLTQFSPVSDGPPEETPEYLKTLDARWRDNPLKPAALGAAPAEGGVIIARIRGLSLHEGIGIEFTREGPKSDTPASLSDRMLDVADVWGNYMFQSSAGTIIAIAVPAGRWRISSVYSIMQLNFCLGAPDFEVKPGEVIYAGAFDLSKGIAPDLDLNPVRTWLAGYPQAATVKAAIYTNGSLGRCRGGDIYALEVEGAPFAAGYAWGSKVPATPPASNPNQQ